MAVDCIAIKYLKEGQSMSQVLFARVPDELAGAIKALAKQNGRSVNAELIIAVGSHLRKPRTPQDAQVLAAAFPERPLMGWHPLSFRGTPTPTQVRAVPDDIAGDGKREFFPFGRWRG
jgi:Arc-like DNA binding domain